MSSSTISSRPLASTPPSPSPSLSPVRVSEQNSPVSRLQLKTRTTPPPSPSPFMKDFAATERPPATAVQAICARSTSPSFSSISNVRRVHVLLALAIAIVLLLSTVGPTAILSANLARNRFQHDESFAYRPVHTRYPAYLPNVASNLHLHRHRRDTRIARRQPQLSAPLLNPKAPSTPTQTSSSATPTSLATAPPIPTVRPPLPTPFPQPFDDTLSAADFVSGACQQFFTAFTNDISFRSCRAFSFLYAASEQFLDMLDPHTPPSFGNLTDPLDALTDVLWGICNTDTDQPTCAARMAGYEVKLQSVCKAELDRAVPFAVTTLNAFRNFDLMRTAACLANQRTGSYCFVDAVAAADNGVPSDIYFYQLPLGTPLPGTDTTRGVQLTATCSTCTRSLMGVYVQYIPRALGGSGRDNGTALLIQRTYHDAAVFLSKQCGTGYASAISVSTAHRRRAPPAALWLVLGLGALGLVMR